LLHFLLHVLIGLVLYRHLAHVQLAADLAPEVVIPSQIATKSDSPVLHLVNKLIGREVRFVRAKVEVLAHELLLIGR